LCRWRKLFGFIRAIRLVYPIMKAKKWGRIVNTIGGAGKEPDPYMFGSGITNSALLNITKSLSTEFGKDGVLVNAVCALQGEAAFLSASAPCAARWSHPAIRT
jgi:NAD(P)-dependent dehydrogenase (short-subunit alcohol dehydrogenase family)